MTDSEFVVEILCVDFPQVAFLYAAYPNCAIDVTDGFQVLDRNSLLKFVVVLSKHVIRVFSVLFFQNGLYLFTRLTHLALLLIYEVYGVDILASEDALLLVLDLALVQELLLNSNRLTICLALYQLLFTRML